ncbi:hypothetical protein AAVH_35840, partial [Aphelenchoides avenae]
MDVSIGSTQAITPLPEELLPASYWANYSGRCPPGAVNCFRMFEAWEFVTLALCILAFTFHCVVFNFILRQMVQKHPYFSSPFYKLYLVLAGIEILHSLQDSFYARVSNYGLFLDIFENNVTLCRIDYFFSGYFSYVQCFLHVLMAANRFTVFAFPLAYKRIWKNNIIMVAVAALAVLPLPFLSFRIPADAEYFYVGPNQIGIKYTDHNVRFFAGLTSASISVSTSIASAAFEIAGLVCFRRYAKKYPVSEGNRNNLRLLFCTFLMLLSQAMLTSYHCLMIYGTVYNAPGAIEFAQKNASAWVFDQFTLNSAICLVIA